MGCKKALDELLISYGILNISNTQNDSIPSGCSISTTSNIESKVDVLLIYMNSYYDGNPATNFYPICKKSEDYTEKKCTSVCERHKGVININNIGKAGLSDRMEVIQYMGN